MTPLEASQIADEQIRHWQNRGVTTNNAWEALGHARRGNATWAMVRAHMVRWLLTLNTPAAPRPLQRAA